MGPRSLSREENLKRLSWRLTASWDPETSSYISVLLTLHPEVASEQRQRDARQSSGTRKVFIL